MRAWWDPRLDPRLSPTAWERAFRRRRRLLGGVLLLLLLLVVMAGYGYASTRDKTRGLQPEEVAYAAGMALARASSYRFTVHLTGESPDGFFPTARMRGAFRREPLLLHLAGEAGSGPGAVPLEYYLEGETLYVKDPRSGLWLQMVNPNLDELQAFQPANLAAPLVSGVRSATVVGRERLEGGEALMLELDVDPEVMRIQPSPDWERIDYRLWVHTGSLRPMLFEIGVTYRAGDAEADASPQGFLYQIAWEFDRLWHLSVPREVKAGAVVP